MQRITGSIVALVTPFNQDGSTDFVRLRELVDWHIENKTDALLVLGTTGETASTSLEEDIKTLDCVLTQAAGRVPVIAGIMPVTNAKQIKRIMSLSSSSMPTRFKAIVDRFANNPEAMKQAGIAYATEQIIDLIANDVTHIHIYTMNRPDIAGSIMTNLSKIIDGYEAE